ncbi:hypothetical protein CEXT_178361 [Caerostris extrusa]|uniref:Uncharacterized protein n=1 Tax=Caerostris extrusa TaxID=172846 RepID=A0AAV4QQV4_CAEEX|nr:hypothetical protein CEXT_178361 [Caerostris extrusa]
MSKSRGLLPNPPPPPESWHSLTVTNGNEPTNPFGSHPRRDSYLFGGWQKEWHAQEYFQQQGGIAPKAMWRRASLREIRSIFFFLPSCSPSVWYVFKAEAAMDGFGAQRDSKARLDYNGDHRNSEIFFFYLI